MAIKRSSKISSDFSSASMSDIVFQLLLFMIISATFANPNAIKVVLPQTTNKVADKAYIAVSITADNKFYVETTAVSADELEAALQAKLEGMESPMIALYSDEKANWGMGYKVMEIATRNNYRLLAAGRGAK